MIWSSTKQNQSSYRVNCSEGWMVQKSEWFRRVNGSEGWMFHMNLNGRRVNKMVDQINLNIKINWKVNSFNHHSDKWLNLYSWWNSPFWKINYSFKMTLRKGNSLLKVNSFSSFRDYILFKIQFSLLKKSWKIESLFGEWINVRKLIFIGALTVFYN